MNQMMQRRQALRWGVGLLGMGALAGVGLSRAELPADYTPPPMEAVQVGPHSWYVEGLSALGSSENQNFISNAGFVVTPEGVVVIDGLGSPVLAERLLAEIAKVTDQPVKLLLLTHYHADHVYGLQVFQDLGVPIIAHEAGREYLHSHTTATRLEASRVDMAPWVDENTRIVPADEWIDGLQEHVLGGVRILVQPVGPAHTPEDIVVYVPNDRVLYSGDVVFANRVPYVGEADSRSWLDALDRLREFGTQVIVPGHGGVSRDADRDIVTTRNYLNYLRESMRGAAEDLTPFDEAYAATDWSEFESLPLFDEANRMNAYNTYLLMEDEAQ